MHIYLFCHTKKVEAYQSWLDRHCHYNFQIMKCQDRACCEEPTTPSELLTWLPDPVLQPDGQHFKSYDESKLLDTTEEDRPSLKILKKSTKSKESDVSNVAVTSNAHPADNV